MDPELVSKAAGLQIWDSKGDKMTFGDLFKDQKTVAVFIRHFFCGICQGYISQLSQVPVEALRNAGVKLVVVGCGDWELIEAYKENTSFDGDIYADPTRALYRTLGMTVETLATTPKGETKKSYVGSLIPVTLRSIWSGPLKNPRHVGKQGNISQLGGEFIFGPGNSCSYSHFMQHTQDHVEVRELMEVAGVTFG